MTEERQEYWHRVEAMALYLYPEMRDVGQCVDAALAIVEEIEARKALECRTGAFMPEVKGKVS